MLGWAISVSAQPVRAYTLKDGRMTIALGKDLPAAELNGFIEQFSLQDLALDKFFRTGFTDSIRKHGWKIEINNRELFVISKLLLSFDQINDPGKRIAFTGDNPFLDVMFPAVSNMVKYGYNRFRNKYPFAIRDSVVTFFMRGEKEAKRVMLAGSFNNWNPVANTMLKTDSGWIARIKLGPGKYWYKFVIDDNWITDPDNRLNENDGLGNTNSVFYYPNTLFRLPGFKEAKNVIVTGSFNNWNEQELAMERTATGWELPVYLADGTHTYRYIVDKKWMTDPSNPDKLPNEFDDFNSVIRIGNPYTIKLEGYTGAKQVFLTGSFNGWKKEELLMQKTSRGWETGYTLAPGNYEYRFIVDGKSITDPANPPLAGTGSKANSLLVIEPNYTFRLKGFKNARKVFLSGDFNDWSQGAMPMRLENDEWVFSVHLSRGKHLYKFIVDGKWIIDPGNMLWEQNEHGTGNSVIWFDKK
jgi:hypothetical protein